VRRLLVAGSERADVAALVKELDALDGLPWKTDMVVPLADAAERCRTHWPDAVVVHAAGTRVSELEDALRWFRGSARVPVIVVSEPGQVEHRLAALAHAVDDDAVLPLDARELAARAARVVVRRDATRRLPLGDLALDSTTNEVTRRSEVVRLTPAEFRLVARLAASPNDPVSLDDLANELGDAASRNTVQVHVSSLRRKLERTGPALIHTAHRKGYVLRPTPAVDLQQRLALLVRREELVKAREEAIARRTELLKHLEQHSKSPRR
jgi:DNA-binding response OmpR family regulator